MTHSLESLAQRLAVIEARLGIEPEPQAEQLPPLMTLPDRPRYQEYDQAQGLRDQIAADEAELVEALAEAALWHAGQHPSYPDGPSTTWRPGLLQKPDLLRRSIADRQARLDQLEGKRRLAPSR